MAISSNQKKKKEIKYNITYPKNKCSKKKIKNNRKWI